MLWAFGPEQSGAYLLMYVLEEHQMIIGLQYARKTLQEESLWTKLSVWIMQVSFTPS